MIKPQDLSGRWSLIPTMPWPTPTRTRLPGEEHVPEAVAAYQTQSMNTAAENPARDYVWRMAIAQSRHENENPGLLLMLLFWALSMSIGETGGHC